MDTKERALKGPQDTLLLNGHELPPPPARRLPMISWTTFSIGVNFALLAMMFVQPSSPSEGYFCKARLLPQAHLRETNGSATCKNPESNTVLCLPRPPSPRLSSSPTDHLQLCSGNGHYVISDEAGACHCHACFSGVHCEQLHPDCHLNLFQ